MTSPFDARPIIVALAGPNGAGKSTFYQVHLAAAGLRFVNVDDLARELQVSADEAARLANRLRETLVEQRESFVFETVLSDPVGDKVEFLRRAGADLGYAIVLCFIGVASAEISEERVSMRVLQGGHDVPSEKVAARFPRALANLRLAMAALPHVLVFDNSDLSHPFRMLAEFRNGALAHRTEQRHGDDRAGALVEEHKHLPRPAGLWHDRLMQDRSSTEPASERETPERPSESATLPEAEFRARLAQLEDFIRFLQEGRSNLRPVAK